MRRKILAVLAAAPLVLLGVPAAQASITPDTTFKFQNTSAGGCAKDQGYNTQYTVSACSVASNFTEIYSQTIGGVTYYEYEDGSNHCPTISAGRVMAGGCQGASTQLFIGPTPLIQSLWDVRNAPYNFWTKGTVSPYYLNSSYTGTDYNWEKS